MATESTPHQIPLSHNGHAYCVILTRRMDGRYSWSYALDDVLIEGVKEPAKDEITALSQAVRVARAHIGLYPV